MRIVRVLSADGRRIHGEIDSERVHVFEGDPFTGAVRGGETLPIDDVALLSPVQPGKILLMLGGFLPPDGTSLPADATPLMTPKIIDGEVIGDGADFLVPPVVTEPLWTEPEVALVIGASVQEATRAEAEEAILGYTVINDLTAPQFIVDATGDLLPAADFLRAKSIGNFAALGPWIETGLSEEDFARGVTIRGRINGEVAMEGTTRTAKFAPAHVVEFLSRTMTLNSGDVIAMGTPRPTPARPGDTVEAEVEGIGSIRNKIVTA